MASVAFLVRRIFMGAKLRPNRHKLKSNRVTYDTNKVKLPELLPPCLFIVMSGSRRWEVKYRSSYEADGCINDGDVICPAPGSMLDKEVAEEDC